MGFFDFFKRKSTSLVETEKGDKLPEVSKEDSVEDASPKSNDIMIISFGTGMPRCHICIY